MSEGWQDFSAAIHFTITNVVKFQQRIRSGNFYLPIDLTSKTLNTHEQMQYRQLQRDKASPPFAQSQNHSSTDKIPRFFN